MDIPQPGADCLVGIGVGRLHAVRHCNGPLEKVQVLVERTIDGNLPDGRANGGNANAVRVQRLLDPGHLLIAEIQYIRIPDAAQVQEANFLAAEYRNLFLQVSRNLVGEGRKANHDNVTSWWVRADS